MVFQRICAVVVTHNRKHLLAGCLEALQRQTRPPEAVLVVDNASTDGTRAMLAERFPAVHRLALTRNTGGAGGFHAGMHWGYERGFDGLWLMDDDCVPEPACLQRLAENAPAFLVRAPLVLSVEDEDRLAFGYQRAGDVMQTRADAQAAACGGLLIGVANPFNGLLVHREAVAVAGFPLPELFIWGDEREYLCRLRTHGMDVATVVAARLKHPPNRMSVWETQVLGRRIRLPYAEDAVRQYLFTRNDAFIARRYRGWTGLLDHLARHIWFNLTRRGLRATLRSLRASWDGARGHLHRHEPLLDERGGA